MKQDLKTGKIVPNYSDERFNFLVNIIRFGNPEDVYSLIDGMATDERTKWRILDKAMQKARELTIDNGMN